MKCPDVFVGVLKWSNVYLVQVLLYIYIYRELRITWPVATPRTYITPDEQETHCAKKGHPDFTFSQNGLLMSLGCHWDNFQTIQGTTQTYNIDIQYLRYIPGHIE